MYDLSVVYLWLSVVCLWLINDLSMIYLWFFYGCLWLSKVYPWFYYGLSMVYPWSISGCAPQPSPDLMCPHRIPLQLPLERGVQRAGNVRAKKPTWKHNLLKAP